jgi:hypothetical protein
MNPEEKARLRVDELLAPGGWVFQTKGRVDFSAARGLAMGGPSLPIGELHYYAGSQVRRLDSISPGDRDNFE